MIIGSITAGTLAGCLALWERRKLINAASIEELLVVCMRVPEGIDEAVSDLVNKSMDAFQPDYFSLIQPDTYIFFFRRDDQGHQHSVKAVELLTGLADKNERCKSSGLGQASGPLLVVRNSRGIASIPLGEAITKAQRLAQNT